VHLNSPEVFFPLLVANGITGVREMFTAIPIETIREWRMRADVPRIYAPGFLDGPTMKRILSEVLRRRKWRGATGWWGRSASDRIH
jgi:hypothetical protein